MPTATAPTRTGYTFNGYWDVTSDGNQYYDISMASVRNWDKPFNTTLYARWIDAQWARKATFIGYDGSSVFESVAVDSSGNIYAAGYQSGEGVCTYGEGVSIAGTNSNNKVILVKYNSTGTALWAKSETAGTYTSEFNSVAVDSSGNVYAAGEQLGTGSFTYGEGVSVAGTSSGYNVVLVKYNSSGTALWAKSVTAGTNHSRFNSVAVDSSGNIYAAGEQWGTGSFTYGEGVSVAGTYGGTFSGGSVVIVKYNSDGVALWAKSVTTGTSISRFNSVAVDSSGNVYAAGSQNGDGVYTYGPGVSVAVTYGGSSSSVVLVKYNSTGTALWAKSVTAGYRSSYFNSVAVDSSGNVYAAGKQDGTLSLTYGDGVSVAGTCDFDSGNVVLVKYNSTGTALWARSVTAGISASRFNSVAVDSSGSVYAAGYQSGTGSYTYGAGVSVVGTYSTSNVVLVKYNPSGTALWAKSVTAGTTGKSNFNSVAVDSSGNIYATGESAGSITYGYGVSVAGDGLVLVKYGNP